MKKTFTKTFGKVTEAFDIILEDKWIYVHYSKGTKEQTACILKNDSKPIWEYISGFLEENRVSEEIKKDIKTYLMGVSQNKDSKWKDFTGFLIKALSLHLVIGVILGLSIFTGFKIGSLLDTRYAIFPTFTLVGVFSGISVGGLGAYGIVYKYMRPALVEVQKKKKKPKVLKKMEAKNYPIIDVTIEDVQRAVRSFSEDLPGGVYRTILIQDDHSIDFKQLAHLLDGIPSKNFYMSRETYDIFDEEEKHIPGEMDIIQRAVDQYMKEHKQYPMLKFDPSLRVNYFQLIHAHLLQTEPQIQFYITDVDGLVSHKKQKKSKSF